MHVIHPSDEWVLLSQVNCACLSMLSSVHGGGVGDVASCMWTKVCHFGRIELNILYKVSSPSPVEMLRFTKLARSGLVQTLQTVAIHIAYLLHRSVLWKDFLVIMFARHRMVNNVQCTSYRVVMMVEATKYISGINASWSFVSMLVEPVHLLSAEHLPKSFQSCLTRSILIQYSCFQRAR